MPNILTGTPNDDRYVEYDYSGSEPGSIDMGAGNDSVVLISSPAAGLTISNAETIFFRHDWHAEANFGPVTITDFTPGHGGDFIALEPFARATLLGNGWPGNVSPFAYGLMRLVQDGANTILQVDYRGTGEFTNAITFLNTQASAFVWPNFWQNGWTLDYPVWGHTVTGDGGSNVLNGSAGPDVINGQAGDDLINGGYGHDVLTGGPGADGFIFARTATHIDPASRPTITDFNPAEDRIDISQYGYRYFADVLSRAYQDGGNVIIEFAPMERLTLQNVQLSSLTAGNFVGILPGSSITALPPPETIEANVRFQQLIAGPIVVTSGEILFGNFAGGLLRAPDLTTSVIQITNHGTIWASGYSNIYAFNLSDGTNYQAANITNTGAIYSVADAYSGVISGVLLSLNNSGVIAGVAWGGESVAVETFFSGTDLVNSGTISARGSTYDSRTSIAVAYMHGLGYDGSIVNQQTGRIVVEAPSAIAIYIDGVPSQSADGPIRNHGLIQAVSTSDLASLGFYIASGVGGYLTLENTGTLTADIAVYLETHQYNSQASAAARITNLVGGRINGDMIFAGRGDSFINYGTMTGNLFAGAGDDVIDTSAGRINGYVDLGEGNDTFIGAGDSDEVYGGAGNDTLTGNGGDDFLEGEAGNDTLNGGAGFDMAGYAEATAGVSVNLAIAGAQNTGGAGIDTLTGIEDLLGSAYNDQLTGNSDGNVILAGAGQDLITGGAGADFLSGGAGGDSFQDTKSGLNGDTIVDFHAGDRIVFTDASLAGFSYSLSGNTLTYAGGTLTLSGFVGQLTALAAAGGEVQLVVSQQVATHGDGSRTIVDYDVNNSVSTSQVWSAYDTQNRLSSVDQLFDNGTRTFINLDEAGTQSWVQDWFAYDAQGRLSSEDVLHDNGTRTFINLDEAGVHNWAQDWFAYDSQGRLSSEDVHYDNGTRTFINLDQDDSQSWNQVWFSYDAQGRLDTQDVLYDDGSRTFYNYDQAGTEAFAVSAILYNSAGTAYQQVITWDDGTTSYTMI